MSKLFKKLTQDTVVLEPMEKAKEILDFEAKITLDESLDKIIPWVEQQVKKGLI